MHAGQVDQRPPRRRGSPRPARRRACTRAAAPGRVEVGRARSTLTPPAADVDHDDVVARRQHEHVGQAAAQHRRQPSRRPSPPATVMSDVERDAAEDRPVGQAGQQRAPQRVGARPRRSPRWRSPSGRRARAPRPGPAPRPRRRARAARSPSRPCSSGRWRPSQPSSARSSQNGGQRLRLGLEQGPGGAAGVVLGQEVRGGLPQGAVVFGDGDRHG